MDNDIGEFAGVIWRILHEKGALTPAQIKKESNGSDFLVSAALGWLAREGKLKFSTSGKTFKISLK